MRKRPGLYDDIGKKARDLLHRNYAHQPPNHYHDQCIDWNLDFSCQFGEIIPGLKAAIRLIIPDSTRAELRYVHDYIGINAGLGLKANTSKEFDPIVYFSGVVGTTLFSMGTALGFDMSTRALNKFNIGFTFNTDSLLTSLSLNDKFDSLEAAMHYTFNHRTTIAAEVKHNVSEEWTTVTIGAQHAVFPFTLVKARANTDGRVGALVRQHVCEKLYIAISGEVDIKTVKSKTPKLGFSMALSP
ncbi:mitochondrial outer membrane protein porin of 36 kDa-like isoform X2 [Carica papaya]|uniref:mitochondrial outer membrane protein porin of 36 kDa-like isoform X2 n=1 Tax=Carica papaya TaxID=3649 RepID=UPI000B8D06C8|nr:mitochondrial outer membrane protein porin of 36 kDa-like isoform X2 [Carica papaya]